MASRGHNDAIEVEDRPDETKLAPMKTSSIDEPDPRPSFYWLLPNELQFIIVDTPIFSVPGSGPPRDEPAEPTAESDLSMVRGSYLSDLAASYYRDSVGVVRSGSEAFIRLKFGGESFENVDEL